jgi:predicted transcriptional regulator
LKAILLSIKPEYVKKILAGTKKYEYRRRLAKEEISTILIYSTYPVMKVVAQAEVSGTICANPSALWEKTKANAGISRKKYREYFQGCKKANAYELGEIKAFDEPKSLLDYNISFAPQSFVYVTFEDENNIS